MKESGVANQVSALERDRIAHSCVDTQREVSAHPTQIFLAENVSSFVRREVVDRGRGSATPWVRMGERGRRNIISAKISLLLDTSVLT